MKRSFESDMQYISMADVHAGEGGMLGEQASKSILTIAVYWMEKLKWNSMSHPDIARIKKDSTRVIMWIPPKSIPKGLKFRHPLPARTVFAHWSRPAVETKAITPSKHSLDLAEAHGGFWSSDRRGIKPLQGMPELWMYLPALPGGLR